MSDSLKIPAKPDPVLDTAPESAVEKAVRKFQSMAVDQGGSLEDKKNRLPEKILRKVSYISAYLMLRPGETVIDMGCAGGDATYMLALLNPEARIIGLDKDAERIKKAARKFQLPNLAFRAGDITRPEFPDNSVDAIVNSNILHELYSVSNYNARPVVQALESQRRILKPGGKLLIRDFIAPPEDEYVQLELPDTKSTGKAPMEMSDADLLIRFSQTARPRDPYNQGFYLEEIPARHEGTRLFRLSHKWALEFIYRKDYREDWGQELQKEYTFFTYQDFKRELGELGMRAVYSAPYRNPWIVENSYQDRFRLFNDHGRPMDYPPTNFFLLSQKMTEKQSLLVHERRPSQVPPEVLKINKITDRKTGKMYEVISVPGEYCDIVPYRIAEDGTILVYAVEGHPRPLVNVVPRGSVNLDGKRWSGHLIEPMRMDTTSFDDSVDGNIKKLKDFLDKKCGLTLAPEEKLVMGPSFYPAPHFIEEKVESVFVEVSGVAEANKIFEEDGVGFSSFGTIREFEAEDLLRSAQVGLLPESRLEFYLYALFNKLEQIPPAWLGTEEPLPIADEIPEGFISVDDILDKYEDIEEHEFEEVEGDDEQGDGSGDLFRPMRSVFVEEGQVEGALAGLSSQDVEFVTPELGESTNIAVVIPLMRAFSGEALFGFQLEHLPVPSRIGNQKKPVATAPMIPLPKDIETVDQAKEFVAAKFGVLPEMVAQLGESYFIHIGVTPQRVYPFVIAPPKRGVRHNTWIVAPIKNLWHLCDGWLLKTAAYVITKTMAEVHGRLVSESELAPSYTMAPIESRYRPPALEAGSLESRLIRRVPKTEAAVDMVFDSTPPLSEQLTPKGKPGRIDKTPDPVPMQDFHRAMKRGLPLDAQIRLTRPSVPAPAPERGTNEKPEEKTPPPLVARRKPQYPVPTPKPSWATGPGKKRSGDADDSR